MSFLAPQYLYGLVALSIPVILHLINLRKARKIYFTKTSLLRNVEAANRQKILLKQYLILLSRILFLGFLILAFAQPTLKKEAAVPNQSDRIVIFLDNSYSMSNRAISQNLAFDEAILAAEKIIASFPLTSTFKLITNDFAPSSNFFFSGAEVNDRLTEIDFSSQIRGLDQVLRRAKKEPFDRLYLISDFQEHTLIGPQDTVNDVIMVPVRYESSANIFIDSAYLDNPFIFAGEDNELIISVRNNSERDISDQVINFSIDSVNQGTANIDIPAGSSVDVTFPLKGVTREVESGIVEFEDYPVSFDNSFFVNLAVSSEIEIVLVSANPESLVPRLYRNENLFHLTAFSPEDISYSAVAEADLVILEELDRSNDLLDNALKKVLTAGGSVVNIPPVGDQVIMGNTYTLAGREASTLGLSVIDYNNPFFKNIFEEEERQLDMPIGTGLFSFRSVNPLLEFRNGDTFLGYQLMRNGRFYRFSAPLRADYSNFLRHALSLPIFYKIAFKGFTQSRRLYLRSGDDILYVQVGTANRTEEPIMISGENTQVIPQQELQGNEVKLSLEQLNLNSGFFQLRSGDRTIGQVAVNYPKDESILRQILDEDALREKLPTVNFSMLRFEDTDKLAAAINKSTAMGTLWKYFLVLSIVFLLAEVLIIRLMKNQA